MYVDARYLSDVFAQRFCESRARLSGELSYSVNRLSKFKIENRMAEGVRFELTRPFGLPVFKTGAINRSATPPKTL